jgi:hypothetical protein
MHSINGEACALGAELTRLTMTAVGPFDHASAGGIMSEEARKRMSMPCIDR